MQGLWKDTKKNFVKDKKRAYHRIKSNGSEGAIEKALKDGNHVFETWTYWQFCAYAGQPYKSVYKFYGYRLGIDLSYHFVCKDMIHTRKHSRRKVAQMIVNRMNRTIIRDYIKRGDWEKEVPTHSYSKSIAWMID